MGNICTPLSIFILLQIRSTLSIQNDGNVCQNTKHQARTDCDPTSGWQCDYEPEFSHRNGDHSFCDLDVISLDDKLINTIY